MTRRAAVTLAGVALAAGIFIGFPARRDRIPATPPQPDPPATQPTAAGKGPRDDPAFALNSTAAENRHQFQVNQSRLVREAVAREQRLQAHALRCQQQTKTAGHDCEVLRCEIVKLLRAAVGPIG